MNQLPPFLPSEKDFRRMNNFEFEIWVEKALVEIPKRKELRDPINLLKERISQILNMDTTEEKKEELVLLEIMSHKASLIDTNQRN